MSVKILSAAGSQRKSVAGRDVGTPRERQSPKQTCEYNVWSEIRKETVGK